MSAIDLSASTESTAKRAGGKVSAAVRIDGANWAKDYTSLLKDADDLRGMRKDLGALPKNGGRPQRAPQKGTQGGGAPSNRQKKRDAWRTKQKERERGGKTDKKPDARKQQEKKKTEHKKPDEKPPG